MFISYLTLLKNARRESLRFSTVLFLFLLFLNSCKKIDLADKNNTDAYDSNDALAVSAPNVILILADDFGYELPTVNGGQSYNTPNIDQLARDGMSFTQCYASANCSPSRFMLLSGKYNFRNYTEWGVMDRSTRTIGNMLNNAGYQTCYVGKWQLDGGDTSIHAFGFNNYKVWLPYKFSPEESGGSRYKDPVIYEKGNYLPADSTVGKYSVDMFTNYALKFIRSNTRRPFFLYYSIPLTHKPFSPTPEDPEFASWNSVDNRGDKRFFPSMVQYLDKQVRILGDSVRSLGLRNRTIFIFVGDNGTAKDIVTTYKGQSIEGGKGKTTTYGTHVPLIVTWPKTIAPNRFTSQLVDLTDFVPTLSDLTGAPIPADFGIVDGKSFYPVLMGSPTSSRTSVFNYFQPLLSPENEKPIRYVQDSVYKLYDDGKFYNMSIDINEMMPLKRTTLTPEEKATQRSFQKILDEMH